MGMFLGNKVPELGLFISKGIVEAHGGIIPLISSPAQETSISFSDPIFHKTNNLRLEYGYENQKLVGLAN